VKAHLADSERADADKSRTKYEPLLTGVTGYETVIEKWLDEPMHRCAVKARGLAEIGDPGRLLSSRDRKQQAQHPVSRFRARAHYVHIVDR
jgi:hypothetical protein